MPMIRKEVSVPANSTIDNVISGSIYEFLPWNAQIALGTSGSATGLVVTINTGSDTVLEESPVPPTNHFPVIPDDMDVVDVAAGGERVVVKVRNTTAGALTFFLLIQLQPLG